MKRCIIIVKGKVQGVGFRRFAVELAKQYQITGYAKNLYDGSVKIIAIGEADSLELFREMIGQGNRRSEVEEMFYQSIENSEDYQEFYRL